MWDLLLLCYSPLQTKGGARAVGDTRTGQVLAQRWLLHRGALIELLDRLPEWAATFRAWPGGMSTLELANHIADHAERYMAPALGTGTPPEERISTLAGARDRLARQADRLKAEILGRTGSDLGRVVRLRRLNLTAPAGELIQLHVQHEAYHIGQLVYHARMLGVDPPYFVQNLWAFADPGNWPRRTQDRE